MIINNQTHPQFKDSLHCVGWACCNCLSVPWYSSMLMITRCRRMQKFRMKVRTNTPTNARLTGSASIKQIVDMENLSPSGGYVRSLFMPLASRMLLTIAPITKKPMKKSSMTTSPLHVSIREYSSQLNFSLVRVWKMNLYLHISQSTLSKCRTIPSLSSERFSIHILRH